MTLAGEKAILDHISVNEEAQAALKKIGLMILLSCGSAIAGVLLTLVPEAQTLIGAYLPGWLVPMALVALNALVGWLNKLAAKDVKAAVSKALVTPVPEPFVNSYTQR